MRRYRLAAFSLTVIEAVILSRDLPEPVRRDNARDLVAISPVRAKAPLLDGLPDPAAISPKQKVVAGFITALLAAAKFTRRRVSDQVQALALEMLIKRSRS